VKLLEEEGVDFDRVNYFVDALDEATLRDVLAKGDLSPRDVLRTRDKAFRELGLDDESVGDDAIIAALVEHPGLLQRPIVVKGDRAVLGRPIENVRHLF
jgi:arsenate reductase